MPNVFRKKSLASLHGARIVLTWCKGVGVLFTSLPNSFPCRVFDFGQLFLKKTKAKKEWKGEGEMNYFNYFFPSH